MVAGRMKDAKNNDNIALDTEENLVRESHRQYPAKSVVIRWELPGKFFQSGERSGHAQHEFIAQTPASGLIPFARVANVFFGGWT